MTKVLSYMDVPSMSKQTFHSTEEKLGRALHILLIEEMEATGREERRLAVKCSDSHKGVPAITVIVDGGWSKRSHKYSYNAKSGVAVVIGKLTKQLLYLGVRNNLCAVCAQAEKVGQEPRAYTYCLNWSGSSSAMEADILVKGFCQAEEMYGLLYIHQKHW